MHELCPSSILSLQAFHLLDFLIIRKPLTSLGLDP